MKFFALIFAALVFVPSQYYSGPIASTTTAVKVHADPGNVFTWIDTKDWLMNQSVAILPLNIDLNSDTVYDASSSAIRLTVSRIIVNFTDAFAVPSINRCFRVTIEESNGKVIWEHKLNASEESRADQRDSKFEWLDVPFVLPVSSVPLNLVMYYNGNIGSGTGGTARVTVHGRLLSFP